jgi:hypothetical protein
VRRFPPLDEKNGCPPGISLIELGRAVLDSCERLHTAQALVPLGELLSLKGRAG